MGVQNSFYIPDGSTRTFPSTKHIATKQHCAVYLQRAIDSLWEAAEVETYDLIQNAIVFDVAVDPVLYIQVEIRVADSSGELVDSPSDISIVAGSITAVNTNATNIDSINTNASNIGAINNVSASIADVNTVATHITNVDTVSTNITNVNTTATNIANVNNVGSNIANVNTTATNIANVNTVATDISDVNTVATNIIGLNTIVTNMAEILLADDNAAIATTQAGLAATSATNAQLREWEAEADALTALSYANEAEDVLVNLVTSDGDGTFTYTPQAGVYSAKHHDIKAAASAASINPTNLLHTIGTGAGNPEGYTSTETNTEITNRAQQGKNHLINGAFQVQQYPDIDTAPVAMVNNTYQIDRYMSIITGVTGTIQRLAKSTINGKYVHAVKCIATSTASGTLGLTQKLEVFYNGETKTFGVWVKSNSANARALLNDGVTYTTDVHTGDGTYQFLSFPKTIDASATQLWAYAIISDASGAAVSISTNDYIESTMWQLEDGSVATPFEQQKYGNVLAECKRFLPIRTIAGEAYTVFGQGIARSTTEVRVLIDTDVIARVNPTAITTNGSFQLWDGATAITVTGIFLATSANSQKTISIQVTVASGLTQYRPYILRANNDATAYIQVQTEL